MIARVAIVAGLAACASAAQAPRAASSSALSPLEIVDVSIVRGTATVQRFFGEELGPYQRHVFAHRAELAAFANTKWHVPELPCFAVAMGTGSTLAVLAPAAWPTEACDHATADDLDLVVAHELVHVFHGQHRPDDPELDKAEPVGWFVEGLAVHASGQLDAKRREQAKQAAARGGPQKLDDAWTGPARYAVAGTLAELVDRKLGRAKIVELLAASTNAEILGALGMTEPQLLDAWRAALR